MKLVIVGSQDKAWPEQLALEAKYLIVKIIEEHRRAALTRDDEQFIVGSGESPGLGVDLWVKQACAKLGVPFKPFPPRAANWPAFRKRNIEMADWGDKVIRIKSRYSLTYGSGHCIDDARRKLKDTTTYELPDEIDGEDFKWEA